MNTLLTGLVLVLWQTVNLRNASELMGTGTPGIQEPLPKPLWPVFHLTKQGDLKPAPGPSGLLWTTAPSLNPHLPLKPAGCGFCSVRTLSPSEDGIVVGAFQACLHTYVARSHLCDQIDSKRKTSVFSSFTFREHFSTIDTPCPLGKDAGLVHIAAVRQWSSYYLFTDVRILIFGTAVSRWGF